jgi:hypothetical protein
MTTLDAWKNYRAAVNEQIEAERREAEAAEAQAMVKRNLVRQFWEQHFDDLTGIRIEKPAFDAMKLEDRLEDILADTDPDVVEAIAERGLPGLFSNSVADIIKMVAKNALKEL